MAASRDNNTVISARWPTTSQELQGNFAVAISRIQFFIQHKLLNSGGNNKEHLFAYVHWQKKHPQYDWFGSSAIVCSLHKEDHSYAFIPVQRIFSLCIHGRINVSFSSTTSETIFVAVHRHHF